MSSFEKIVKLACKPKAAPPKSKYMDSIIAATYSEDGAVHDVCKALAPRFREPNAIIVFKALIVLHTMIRNGATDNVLGYLSQTDVLRLRNVSNGQWEGYTAPQNLSNYARYLDYRVHAYKELKHDPIRVQSETNRDLRVGTLNVDEEGRRGSLSGGSGGAANRRQTIVGRKLRIMTVEKGLLRETKIVQKMIDSLLACKFYLDDLEDELTITALRILVKDLLVLFQACNEGVINLLESYFEMAYTDASAALALYRHFCAQTENVVDYLTIARKLENLLNVPIPSLKHALVSLAGSLEEYLRDPNFEQNRIEYKTNKELADKGARAGKRSVKRTEEVIPPVLKLTEAAKKEDSKPQSAAGPSTVEKPKTEVNKELSDFFASIEPDKPNIFNQQASPVAGASSPFNPFGQQQPFAAPVALNGMNPFPLATGLQAPSPFINAQSTGSFPAVAASGLQSHTTGFPGGLTASPAFPAGFGAAAQPTGAPTSNFLSPAAAAIGLSTSPFARPASAAPNFAGSASAGGLLQPQMTGANPFRQSILAPQTTGAPFTGPAGTGPFGASGNSPFGTASGGGAAVSAPFNLPQTTGAPGASPFASLTSSTPFGSATAASTSPFAPAPTAINSSSSTKIAPPFARPASTPITGASGPAAQFVTSHQTGSRNPFGRPKSPPPPPVPPVPTLAQLATGAFGGLGGSNGVAGGTSNGIPSSASPFTGSAFGTRTAGMSNGVGTAPSVNASSIASEFVFNQMGDGRANSAPFATNLFGASASGPATTSSLSPQSTSTSSAAPTFSSTFSAFSATPTGSSITTTTPSISALKPHTTGFGGSAIKPFKPSSSFGATLLESLPTIPQGAPLSTSTSPPPSNANATATTGTSSLLSNSTNSGFGLSGLSAQPTGLSGVGPGIGPRSNGGLQPQMTGGNPFRASMFPGTSSTPPVPTANTPQPAGLTTNPTGFGLGSPPFSTQNNATSSGARLFGLGSSAASATNTGLPNGLTSGTSSLPPSTMPGAFPTFGQFQQQHQPAQSLL